MLRSGHTAEERLRARRDHQLMFPGGKGLQPAKLVTHRFALGDIMNAYDTFANAAKERALKVILTNAKPQ